MARHAVNLTRKTTRKPSGRSYTYWVVRWFRSDGTQAGKSIGRVDKMSRRQAEKLRHAKELEMAERPGRRDVSRAPELQQFLLSYFDARRSELAPGSMELSQQTGRYLLGFFGASRGIDQVRVCNKISVAT